MSLNDIREKYAAFQALDEGTRAFTLARIAIGITHSKPSDFADVQSTQPRCEAKASYQVLNKSTKGNRKHRRFFVWRPPHVDRMFIPLPPDYDRLVACFPP